MSLTELPPLAKTLDKVGLGYVRAFVERLPDELRIEDGELKWSIDGSNPKVPGIIKFGTAITPEQRAILEEAGVPVVTTK